MTVPRSIVHYITGDNPHLFYVVHLLFINRRLDKQTVKQSQAVILLGNKKEQAIDSLSNMSELQVRGAEGQEPDSKDDMLHDSICTAS